MPEVNFYLQKPKPPKKPDEKPRKEHQVFLKMNYAGKSLVYFFRQSVDPKNWNAEKQRVKGNTKTTADGQYQLNDLLDNLEKLTLKTYHELLKAGIPAPAEIRKKLQDFMNGNDGEANTDKPTLPGLIQRFIDNEITYKGRNRKDNTTRSYKTTLMHLQEFGRKHKMKIDFDAITLDFYYQFVAYLKKAGLNGNSIGKEIKNLKTFMAEAVDLDYTNNLQFRHKKFAVTHEDTDAVYLTWDEILKLYRHDFSTVPRLERVRDLFVFGSCVGLRFSDFSRIKPENIIKDGPDKYIKIKTQKTGETVIIPCHPLVLEIFKKYKEEKNTLPRAVSNQKFNDFIKECCEKAGLNVTGRLSTNPELPLWACVRSHTARRSCLTNYYLEGFPVIDLMKISGHKTEKSLLLYLKVSKLDTAKRLGMHIKKNWGKKLLRVA